MPLTECRCLKPLIYHKQGKGEALRHSQAKIEREREWERDWSAENEIKRREKSTYRKTEGKREIMLKYREQTERFSKENMEALAWGNAINEKLKKKTLTNLGRRRLECGAKCHHLYVRVCWWGELSLTGGFCRIQQFCFVLFCFFPTAGIMEKRTLGFHTWWDASV